MHREYMTFAQYLAIVIPILLFLVAVILISIWVTEKQNKKREVDLDYALNKLIDKSSGFIVDRKIGQDLLISKSTKEIMYWHRDGARIIGFDQLAYIEPSARSYGRGQEINCSLSFYIKNKDKEPEMIGYSEFDKEDLFECMEYLVLIGGRKLLKDKEVKAPEENFEDKLAKPYFSLRKMLRNFGPDF